MYKFEEKNITALGFKTQDKYYQVIIRQKLGYR